MGPNSLMVVYMDSLGDIKVIATSSRQVPGSAAQKTGCTNRVVSLRRTPPHPVIVV